MNEEPTLHCLRPRSEVVESLTTEKSLRLVSLEPERLGSPHYTARSFLLGSSSNLNLNGGRDFTHSSHPPDASGKTVEQLQKDLRRLEVNMDEMRWKMNGQLSDLISELDQEKKSRATLQIELERLQKLIQKFSTSK